MSIDICQHDGWIEVMINRPHKKNAMTAAMWTTLLECLGSVHEQKNTRLLVLKGKRGCFSSGADIKELKANVDSKEWLIQNNELVRKVQLSLENLSIATLAVIDGACVGGGCGLALACDYRLASRESFFSLTPGKLGLLYSVDDTRRLVNQIGFSRAKQMLMFAEKIPAEQACNWNLVHELIATEDLHNREAELIQQMKNSSAGAVTGMKRIFGFLSGSQKEEVSTLTQIFNDAFDSDDFAERAQRFLNDNKFK